MLGGDEGSRIEWIGRLKKTEAPPVRWKMTNVDSCFCWSSTWKLELRNRTSWGCDDDGGDGSWKRRSEDWILFWKVARSYVCSEYSEAFFSSSLRSSID